jgi:hypothetical protein
VKIHSEKVNEQLDKYSSFFSFSLFDEYEKRLDAQISRTTPPKIIKFFRESLGISMDYNKYVLLQ